MKISLRYVVSLLFALAAIGLIMATGHGDVREDFIPLSVASALAFGMVLAIVGEMVDNG